MLKRKKFVIGGTVILFALGYLLYTAFAGAATSNYTVSELMSKGNAMYGENVRLYGQVVSGTAERESAGRVLRFVIIDADGKESLPVVYQGVVPDTFKDDGEVVVEGSLSNGGVFEAKLLMPKCPSRYEPAS